MTYLLDTNVIINMFCTPDRLPKCILDAMSTADGLFTSCISYMEIAIKESIGKLNIGESIPDFERRCNTNGIIALPFTLGDLEVMKRLPMLHRDPFDRLIAAQAVYHGFAVITSDSRLAQYAILTLTY